MASTWWIFVIKSAVNLQQLMAIEFWYLISSNSRIKVKRRHQAFQLLYVLPRAIPLSPTVLTKRFNDQQNRFTRMKLNHYWHSARISIWTRWPTVLSSTRAHKQEVNLCGQPRTREPTSRWAQPMSSITCRVSFLLWIPCTAPTTSNLTRVAVMISMSRFYSWALKYFKFHALISVDCNDQIWWTRK